MRAFHGDPKIKEKYLLRVRAHQLAGEIHKGEYANFKERKFCAVGCTIHGWEHKSYEDELGIPMILAKLEDDIFECLPDDRAKKWPKEFLMAIKVGADLSNVWYKFAHWLLVDEKNGVLQYVISDKQKNIIQKAADGHLNFEKMTVSKWQEIKDGIYANMYGDNYENIDAMDSIHFATETIMNAVNSAAYTSVAYATYEGHDAAAEAAVAAAESASYAAAIDAGPAVYVYYAARENHRIAQADKLLELLREAQ